MLTCVSCKLVLLPVARVPIDHHHHHEDDHYVHNDDDAEKNPFLNVMIFSGILRLLHTRRAAESRVSKTLYAEYVITMMLYNILV